MNDYCHYNNELDKQVCAICNDSPNALFNYWDEDLVGFKIQQYNNQHPDDNLDKIDDVETIAKKLMSWEIASRKMRFAHQHSKKRSFTQLIRNFKELIQYKTNAEISEDVDFVWYKFTKKVDGFAKRYGVTREQVCNGFKRNNIKLCGEFNIFELVLSDIEYTLNNLYLSENLTENDKILIRRYESILDNWNGVVLLAKEKLTKSEKMKLGNFLSYGETIDNQDLVDTTEEDLEEASKDPVTRVKDETISSFNKLSQITRHILSTLPLYEYHIDKDGNRVYHYDDNGRLIVQKTIYGTPKFGDATRLHQILKRELRGVRSEIEVYKRLKDLVENNNEYMIFSDLVEMMRIDPKFLTNRDELSEEDIKRFTKASNIMQVFLLDYDKAFQPYLKYTEKFRRKKKKNRSSRVILINEIVDTVKLYYQQIVMENRATSFTLFDKDGYLRQERFDKFIDAVRFFKDSDTTFSMNGKDFKECVDKVFVICKMMGIPFINRNIVSKALRESVNKAMICNCLRNIDNTIISHYKTASHYKYGDKMNVLYDKNGKIEYSKIYEYEDNGTSTMDRLGNQLAALVSDYSVAHAIKLEGRCHYKDEKGNNVTNYSEINAGYLHKFIRDIQGFVKQNDVKGLRAYLDRKFGTNPIFVDKNKAEEDAKRKQDGTFHSTQKFRIQLLNDLYNFTTRDVWDFMFNFQCRRLVSNDQNKPFEKFNEIEDAQATIASYFAYTQASNGKAKFADFRVFISGDANQFKVMSSPIYSTNILYDLLTDLTFMEQTFWNAMDQVKYKMNDDKHKTVNVKTNIFSIFPAFNTIFGESNPKLTQIYSEVRAERGSDVNDDNMLSFVMEKLSRSQRTELIKDYFSLESSSFDDYLNDLIEYKIIDSVDEDGSINVNYKFKDNFKGKNGQLLKGDKLREAVHNMWLNQKYAMASQIAIMTVSPAFYVNLADLQKRYKETHSSGRYVDINAINPFTNENVFDSKFQRTILLTEHKYKCDELDKDFMDVVREVFKDRPDIIEKYQKVEASDGQAYRTIESYRKIALGTYEWTQDMENFYQELVALRNEYKDSEIPEEKLTKLAKNYPIILQPKKPFLFTKEKYGNIDIPVQIKCSEAVIIPELLKKDSRLRHISEYMTENNIDVIAMTSAVKVGSWGDIDIASVKDKNSLFETLSSAVVHDYSYEDYFIQNNVPPHTQEMRLFATQIRKLIIGGKYDAHVTYFGDNDITLTDKNGNKEVHKSNTVDKHTTTRLYNELIMANFLESLKEYLATITDNTEIGETLIRSIIDNDTATYDTCLSFLVDEATKKFTVPLCESINEYVVASNIFALFKQAVNKQTILGGSAVQVSSLGIEGYDESENLHFITKDGNVIYAEVEIPLMHKYKKPYIDKNGNIKYQEVELQYEKYCNEDCTLKTDEEGIPLIDKEFPGIRDFIAYRIPTESSYSMINCKAVRFTRPTAGITIKVPSQGVVISGFDFDIDKLYFMFKTLEKDENNNLKKYDYSKTALENEKSMRDNMIIHIIQKRLEDKNTLEERLTPGGFDNATEIAYDQIFLSREDVKESLKGKKDLTTQEIRRLRLEYQKEHNLKAENLEEEYDYTDLRTLIMLNQRNQIAAKLIGIFANQNVNHTYCMGMSRLSLDEKIAFGSHPEGLDNLLVAPDGINVAFQLAEFLAASVDAVKKPVLGYMNLTEQTANLACLLVRLGYTLNDVSLLLNQPVVKYICNKASVNNSSLSTAITKFYSEINVNIDSIDISNPSQEELLYNIINEEKLNFSSDDQIGIVKLLQQIVECANDLNFLVTKTKFTAANSVKPTFGGYYELINNIDNFKDLKHLIINSYGAQKEPIIQKSIDMNNLSGYIGSLSSNPMAFEQCMYDCMVKSTNQILENFPYENPLYKGIREMFNFFGISDETTINNIHKDLPVYILTILDNSKFNPNINKDGFTLRESILGEEFQHELSNYQILHNADNSNELLNYLFKDNKTGLIRLSYNTLVDERLDKEAITAAWRDIYDSDPIFAEKLFMYNFFRCGFGYGPMSFIHYAPTELKTKMKILNTVESPTYAEFFQNLIDNWSLYNLTPEQKIQFFLMFIANHLDNNNLVTNISGEATEENIKMFLDNDGKTFIDDTKSIYVDTETNNSIIPFVAQQETDENGGEYYIFKPCIKVYDKTNHTEAYFALQNIGFDEEGNISPMFNAVYKRIYSIGSTNSSLQYNNNINKTIPLSEEETYTSIDDDGVGDPTVSEGPIEGNPNIGTPIKSEDNYDELFKEFAHLMSIGRNLSIKDESRKDLKWYEALAQHEQDLTNSYKNDLNMFINDFKQYMDELVNLTNGKQKELIESIYKKVKESGLIVLNEDGESQKSCRI